MQPTDTLATLFGHHRWANLRILECCATLTRRQLETSLTGTFGSIHDTLQHLVMSEQSYFSRISTGQPRRRADDAPPLTFPEMMESVRTTGTGFIEWASRIRPDDLVQVDWDGTPCDVPKTIILTQAINHATEHRAQIMAILTQIGIQPPDLDGWTYFAELDRERAMP